MLWRESATMGVCALVVVLVGYGTWNGAMWVRQQQQTIQTALNDDIERYAQLRLQLQELQHGAPLKDEFSDPMNPAWVGGYLGPRYAVMPPAPAAVLAVGQSDLYPTYFRVSSLSKQAVLRNEELANPLHLLVGRFDLAFVFVTLYPLLILGVSYNLLSAERERGTLSMMLSQPVTLRQVVTGKTLVRAAVVCGAVCLCTLVCLSLSGVALLSNEVLWRVFLGFVVIVIYGGFWFALAFAVNAWGRGSVTNAIALAGAWLVVVVIIPACLNVLVTSAYPVPSRVELIQTIREATTQGRAQTGQLLSRYYEDHPELAPQENGASVPDFMIELYTVQAAVAQRVEPLLTRFDAQLFRQQVLVDRLRLASPALLTHEALTDLAGTSMARYRHFRMFVERYHRSWQDFFSRAYFKRPALPTTTMTQCRSLSLPKSRGRRWRAGC
jgi:ABC-2 type transport system permease protein